MIEALLVAAGAAVGAPLRYLVGRRLDGVVPAGTLVANVVGSLLLGALVGAAVEGAPMALLGTGFCGGLTTYSSFAVQTRDLGGRLGLLYAAATVVLGLAACALGYWAAA